MAYICAMDKVEDAKIRLDKYLWAIRIFKTRSLAAAACNDGKVKLNGELASKASKVVKIDEVYRVKNHTGLITLKVVKLIDKRVSADIAQTCYIDITPEEEKEKQKLMSAFYFSSGKRGNKQARPTKKDRRKITDLRGDI